MPRTPLELFMILNQLQISPAEKNTLEKYVEITSPLFKISRNATASRISWLILIWCFVVSLLFAQKFFFLIGENLTATS